MTIHKDIRVVVADDSGFVREMITSLLSGDPGIRVIGQAVNGKEAVDLVMELDPDIVTMDIHMPVMDGLTAIETIMAYHAVPILVVTSSRDAGIAFEAISRGALEVMSKPEFDGHCAEEFISKIKMLSKVRVISHISGRYQKTCTSSCLQTSSSNIEAVAIAASTGGPKALATIFSKLPETFPLPILVAQHIDEEFIHGLVSWLNTDSRLRVKIAEEDERILPGCIYFFPAKFHLEISPSLHAVYKPIQEKDIYRPSCNVLLNSLARIPGKRILGVILTGMGDDGVDGMMEIKHAGGHTIAQSEESCVVFGMPKLAIDNNCIDYILGIEEISKKMLHLATACFV